LKTVVSLLLDREHLSYVLDRAVEVLSREPVMLRLDFTQVLVVGDTHGDYISTRKALEYARDRGLPVVFLGDYVDRGPQQIENITAVLEAKLENPSRVYLLRGNHETPSMNMYYGFYDTVTLTLGREWYSRFIECFKHMPYVASLRKRVVMLHGGLPQGVKALEDLEKASKGVEEPEDGLTLQIMWNDPSEYVDGFAPSPRGGEARLFGGDVLSSFMKNNNLCLMIRAHEPKPEGYELLFNGLILTVFSCRYYGIKPKAALVEDCGKIKLIDLG